MDERNLDKALEIVAALISGEEIGRGKHENVALYELYITNNEIYELVHKMLKSYHLNLYEYKESLYITAGLHNRVFGYTNDELKKAFGIRLNRELYLCYFIIYNVMTYFYQDSSPDTFAEYMKVDTIVSRVDRALASTVQKLETAPFEKNEENSFKQLALLWEDLPILAGEESAMRAARNSKAGYVKLVFNFLVAQELFLESEERYYPKNRMRALMEDYFEEHQSKLRAIMTNEGEEEDATY